MPRTFTAERIGAQSSRNHEQPTRRQQANYLEDLEDEQLEQDMRLISRQPLRKMRRNEYRG